MRGLDDLDGLVCDLDGVVYRGDVPIPGAPEAIAALERAGVRVLFCTNNSGSTVDEYVAKLRRVGVAARPGQILTSAIVTGEALAARGLEGSALVIGGRGLTEAVTGAGLEIADGSTPAAVVVGWDPDFDYDAMRHTALALAAGAALIASNDDASFPAEGGELWPGAGAILASIERASGRRAEVMGKPHRPMMDAAAARLAGARCIAVVGDRDETDLAGGRAMGWTTILVLSGVTSPAAAATLDPAPDHVVDSLAALAP